MQALYGVSRRYLVLLVARDAFEALVLAATGRHLARSEWRAILGEQDILLIAAKPVVVWLAVQDLIHQLDHLVLVTFGLVVMEGVMLGKAVVEAALGRMIVVVAVGESRVALRQVLVL